MTINVSLIVSYMILILWLCIGLGWIELNVDVNTNQLVAFGVAQIILVVLNKE